MTLKGGGGDMSDLDILRRIAERGLKQAQRQQDGYVDLFQHMLDELERFVKAQEETKESDL